MLEERTRTASAAAKDRFHKPRAVCCRASVVALVLDPGTPFIELSTLAGYMFDVPDADKSVPRRRADRRYRLLWPVSAAWSAPMISGIDCRRATALRARQDAPGAGTGTGETSCLTCNWSKAPAPTCCATASRNFVRGGNIFSKFGAAIRCRSTRGHRDARFFDRRWRVSNRTVRLHRDGARPQPAPFLAGPPLLKAAHRRDRDRGRAWRRRDAHLHLRARRLSRPRTTATRLRIARDNHGQPGMGSSEAGGARVSPARVTTRTNCSASWRWTTSVPVDMRQVIARIIDDSDFTEFGANYGPATVCGHARIEGQAIGNHHQ